MRAVAKSTSAEPVLGISRNQPYPVRSHRNNAAERGENEMIDRSRMAVTMNGIGYPSARQAFMAIGLNKSQRRVPRKELRRMGEVTITFANRTYVIKRVPAH